MQIVVAQDILKANDQIAQRNLERLDAAGVYCINVLGSPGAGKTTLLEALAPHLSGQLRFAVIEGDPATTRDADRIEALGVPNVQINTGGGCHLDANMVVSALDNLKLESLDLLFIENVGNLICPSGYRLGERLRAVILSVAEGDDKVAKYPPMFQRVDALVVNKLDLLPYLEYDLGKVKSDVKRVAPDVHMMTLSAKTGEGVANLADWIVGKRQEYLHVRGS
jgi:hydrogenase nickel incorporation protein HypB